MPILANASPKHSDRQTNSSIENDTSWFIFAKEMHTHLLLFARAFSQIEISKFGLVGDVQATQIVIFNVCDRLGHALVRYLPWVLLPYPIHPPAVGEHVISPLSYEHHPTPDYGSDRTRRSENFAKPGQVLSGEKSHFTRADGVKSQNDRRTKVSLKFLRKGKLVRERRWREVALTSIIYYLYLMQYEV